MPFWEARLYLASKHNGDVHNDIYDLF